MTQEKIDELKSKYGKIFKVDINGKDWFYRGMSRAEFKEYSTEQANRSTNNSQLDMEDLIFIKCNLNDISDVSSVPGGVVSVVAENIMIATGFVENAEPEEL